MAHHIGAGEGADRNVVDAIEHAHGDLEAADLVLGQVDLGDIAGDDDLGAEADAGQEHLHLFAGGVLCLVQDDEAVVQGAPAHIGQGRDLDVAALKILLIGIGAQHVEKGIIERTQVGVHLALKVARQKAQALARLDGGAGQNDAVDLFGAEGRHRGRHGEVGLAGARRANAQGHGVVRDRLAVFPLADGLGLDGLALRRDADDVAGELLDLALAAVLHQTQDITHVLGVDVLAAGGKLEQAVDGLFGQHDVFGLTGDMDQVVPIQDFDVELGFDQAQVLVKGPEDADHVFHTLDFNGSVYHSNSFSFRGDNSPIRALCRV